jgi:hypothetical protein
MFLYEPPFSKLQSSRFIFQRWHGLSSNRAIVFSANSCSNATHGVSNYVTISFSDS